MTISCKVDNRKPLVKVISDFTGAKAVYLGTPTYAYQIDCFTVTREGNIVADGTIDTKKVEPLVEILTQQGFSAEHSKSEGNCISKDESMGLTVTIPLEKVSVDNLNNLLKAKTGLLRKALGISDLPVEINEEQVSFPWFAEGLDADAVRAYTNFIAALCKMSREQTRISNTEKPVDNEKYAFRCFLLRLGFVGAEYKTDRKILLKNLSGNSAFKSGIKKEASSDEFSE